MTDRQHPIETELKLTYPANARPAIERHPDIAGAAARQVTQHAVYYDTPDLALHAAGFSLRVRRNGDSVVQTLKCDAASGGAASKRGEWEWQRPEATLELGLLRATPAAEFSEATLQPVFNADVTRTVRELELPGGAKVELALDEGLLAAGHTEAPIREMELELKSGPSAALYRLAVALHAAFPLRILAESKASRGYLLKSGYPPSPAKAEKPDLNRRVTGRAAFRSITESALAGLTRNQAAADAGNPEGTHRMRVSIRKLRAACLLFRPLLEPHATRQFDAALRRLGHVLGDARDWDVFCDETLPAAQSDVDEAGWAGLMVEAAERRRAAAYEALRAEIAAPAITGTVLGIAGWVEDETALGDEELDKSLTETGPALLDKLARKAAKRGRHLKRLSPEELHSLRRTIKKLRYGADYLAGLYEEKAVKRYLQPIEHLQKLLGEINDAAMATSLAERLCEGEALSLIPGLGDMAAWAAKRHASAMAKLPNAWRAFEDAEEFW